MTTQDLTALEVADRLSVDRETVYRWLQGHKGKPPILRGYQLPNRAGWRVRPDDLEAFIEERMNEAPTRGKKRPVGSETPDRPEG